MRLNRRRAAGFQSGNAAVDAAHVLYYNAQAALGNWGLHRPVLEFSPNNPSLHVLQAIGSVDPFLAANSARTDPSTPSRLRYGSVSSARG